MSHNRGRILLSSLAVASCFSNWPGYAHASGFALIEQNASGMGNAYAGAAVATEDASTIYFNPAGLTALPAGRHYSVSIHAIDPSAKFTNNASVSAGGIVAPGIPTPFTFSGMGGDAGSTAYVPNAYFAMNLDSRWSAGVGINAPFGLKTQYEDGWLGRFQGLKSDLKTLNINPTIAYKLNDAVSLGAGLNYQQIDATLTKAINYTAIVGSVNVPAAIAAGNVEGRNELKGKDSGWGFNLGATFRLSDQSKFGIAYRSAIKYNLTGTFTAVRPVTASPAANTIINTWAQTLDQNISVAIKMPDSFSFSFMHRLSDRWDLLEDLTWTGWAKIPEIRIKFTAPGAPDDVTNWTLRNTLRASVGANYRYNDDLKLRFGVAYDQSPVTDAYRTVRLPDNNRTWLSLGAQYKTSRNGKLDAGFSYIWVKSAAINSSADQAITALGYPRGLMNGTYDNSVRVLSLQYSNSF